MGDLTETELVNVFDFLELKRGDKLDCWICSGNEWSARKIRRSERSESSSQEWTLYVQLICRNCKMVVDFAGGVLAGP